MMGIAAPHPVLPPAAGSSLAGPVSAFLLLVSVALGFSSAVFADNDVPPDAQLLHGTVRDEDGAPVAGAEVWIEDGSIRVRTDSEGQFTLATESQGQVLLLVYAGGYDLANLRLHLPADEALNITLQTLVFADAIAVEADAPDHEAESRLQQTWLDVIATAGTAADPFYAAQMLPGVVKIDNGGGLFVRGGDASETASYLGPSRLAHAFRLETPTGGFFGITDGLAIQGLSLASGAFSARYGNALSAVLELQPLGPPEALERQIGLGLGAASLRWSRPLGRSMGIRLAGKLVDAEQVLAVNGQDELFRVAPRGSDLSATLFAQSKVLGNVRLSGLRQQSRVERQLESGAFVGFLEAASANELLTFSAERQLAKVTATWVLTASRHQSETKAGVLDLEQRDHNWSSRLDLQTLLSRWALRAGLLFERTRHRSEGRFPQGGDFRGARGTRLWDQVSTTGRDGAYLEGERAFGRLNLRIGTRWDRYREPDHHSIEPRCALTWTLGPRRALSLAWGVYRQAPSLRYTSTAATNGIGNGNPIVGDFFVEPELQLAQAQHWVLGFRHGEWGDPWQVRIEAFNKSYSSLPLEEAGGRVRSTGDGYARGGELFLRVRPRAGWDISLAYSYLSAQRLYSPWQDLGRYPPQLQQFAPSFAVPHTMVLSARGPIVGAWRWSLSGRFATGRPFTPVLGAADTDLGPVPIYGAVSSDRLPSYRRVDAGINRSFSLGRRGAMVAYLGINDLFDHDNVFRYAYDQSFSQRRPVHDGSGRSLYVGISLLP